MRQQIPELSFGSACKLLGDNFAYWLKLTAIIAIPASILQFIHKMLLGFSMHGLPANNAAPPSAMLVLIASGLALGAILLTLILFALLHCALTQAAGDLCQGRRLPSREIFAKVFDRVWLLAGVMLLQGVILFFGFIALFIPGIIFLVWYAVAIPVALFENVGAWEALCRSRELVRGNWWQVFGALLLTGILTFMATIVITIACLLPAFIMLGGGVFWEALGAGASANVVFVAFQTLAEFLTALFTAAFLPIVSILLYFNLGGEIPAEPAATPPRNATPPTITTRAEIITPPQDNPPTGA